jgi:hypothetical protein
MRRSAAMAFAFLVLYWAAVPLLACMVPDRAMTVQERECCQRMAEMCGSSKMPQSHSCCKTEVRSGHTIVATTDHQPVPVLSFVAVVSMPVTPQIDHHAGVVTDHHPPGEFLPEITVLRI